jgi:hypothetical protein
MRPLWIAAVLAPALAGCGSADFGDSREVRGFIAATEPVAHRFVYTEETLDDTFTVEGLVEDDFRYKAQLSIDGEPAYVEVVRDDAIAARVLSRHGEEIFGSLPTPGWVLDSTGAPDLTALNDRDRGADPVLDALEVFRYIDLVMLRENVIVEFEEEDFDYRPKEDPFEKPEPGSGVKRYDIRPPSLPKASDVAGGNQAVPHATHFRRAAIYVKDGVIVRVQEIIDVAGRLRDIERNYDIDFPDGATTDEKVRISIEAINAVRRGQGLLPIRVRTMTYDLLDIGDQIAVDLPAGATAGDVSALRFRGADDLRPGAQQAAR